jgi:hypothetical protein
MLKAPVNLLAVQAGRAARRKAVKIEEAIQELLKGEAARSWRAAADRHQFAF